MTPDDKDLEALFALARGARGDAPDALTNRVLTDALAVMPKPIAALIVHRPAARRSLFGLDWLQVSGLTALGVLGVVLGVMNPLLSDGLASDSYSLSDLMPGIQDVLSEEVEG